MEVVQGDERSKERRTAEIKNNVASWTIFFVIVMGAYHLCSDGDFSFLLTFGSFVRAFAFAILIWKAYSQKTVAGLSLKTVQLYFLVFIFRSFSITFYQGYLPYDSSGDWLYTLLEYSALTMTGYVIYLTLIEFKSTYEEKYDTFGFTNNVESKFGPLFIALPCILLAICFHPNLNQNFFADVAWTIALYIESAAILPQLFMFQKRGGGTVESCISQFVYALAFGSLMHLWFWLFSYHELAERDAGRFVGYLVIFVQIGNMVMMADFLYFYFKSMKDGGPMTLPVHISQV